MNTRSAPMVVRRAALVARTALPLWAALAAGEAFAQQPDQPPPFGPPPGQPPPGQFNPGGPPPGQFNPGGPPGQFNPGGPPGQFPPGQLPPGQMGPGPMGPGGPGMGPQPPPPPEKVDDAEERAMSLIEQINLLGSTGLFRTSYAGSGAAGTFRVGFVSDFFFMDGFLCNPSNINPSGVAVTCGGSTKKDSVSHVGGFFTLNATPLSFLEGYAQIRTYANSNNLGSPQLLQVLGDTTFGVKAFTPMRIGGYFTFGGEAMLHLLNGTGGVGVEGSGTSATFRALASMDLRKPGGKGFPFRAHLNFGYKLDNSGSVVEKVEQERAKAFTDGRDRQPISRIERFGLGINRVDFVQIGAGLEFPLRWVQPFLEYTVDIPANTRSYQCHTGRVSPGDVCLGLADFRQGTSGSQVGYEAIPSRLSIGVRVSPFDKQFRGLSGLAGVDVGLSATSLFIEEVAPQAPYTVYLGLGYAFDTQEKKAPPPPPAPPPPAPVVIPAPQVFVRGLVHEQGKSDVVVADAIVTFEGGAQPPVATGEDGRFLSRPAAPGPLNLSIKAPGFKPGTCTVTVPPPPPPPMPMPGGPPPMPQNTMVDADCALEALPKLGTVAGSVKDAEGGAGVVGASIKITDAAGKEHAANADGSGSFRVADLPPGSAQIRAEKDGYMTAVAEVAVRANESVTVALQMNKRPKVANVKVIGNEIKLLKQINFDTDSAKIAGSSNVLMEELADVLRRNPNIKKVEIQGHTDNTGTPERNQILSDDRAKAVRDWLVKAGIEASRMVSKGYGQSRPLAPNVTAANRARNRRVQIVILEK